MYSVLRNAGITTRHPLGVYIYIPTKAETETTSPPRTPITVAPKAIKPIDLGLCGIYPTLSLAKASLHNRGNSHLLLATRLLQCAGDLLYGHVKTVLLQKAHHHCNASTSSDWSRGGR